MTVKHHIIPFHEWKKRINPNATRYCKEFNAIDNVVWLTTQQHSEVHKFLYEISGSKLDFLAYKVISGQMGKEEAKREATKLANKNNKYCKGVYRSKEHREAISKAQSGRIHTHEQNKKHSLFMKKFMKGNKNTLGMKFVHEKVSCTHCGKCGGINVMRRWHFNNCKKFNP